MTTFERVLSVIASIVTLAQLFYSIPTIFGSAVPISLSESQKLILPARVIIVFVLETAFAYAFSYLFYLISKVNEDRFIFFSVATLSLISAWVSVFNIQYFLFVTPLNNGLALVKLLPILIIVGLINCFYIEDHVSENSNAHADFYMTVQTLGFVVIYVTLWFQ